MQLHVVRSQKSGMLGGHKFLLTVRAELTSEERRAVDDCRLNGQVLFESHPDARGKQARLNVAQLVQGTTMECGDFMELMQANSQVKEAAEALAKVLKVAVAFEGEEVIDFA